MEKEPTIEFVKWIIEKAEGFEYCCEIGLSGIKDNPCNILIKYRSPVIKLNEYIESMVIGHPVYDSLLQKAIEGVNRESDKWIIIQTNAFVRLVDKDSAFKIPEVDYKLSEMSPDKTKQAALMYIKEQEKTNE